MVTTSRCQSSVLCASLAPWLLCCAGATQSTDDSSSQPQANEVSHTEPVSAPAQCCGCVDWAFVSNATQSAQGNDLAVDPRGSIILAGEFSGDLTLGGAVTGTLSSTGNTDAFLAQLTAQGTPEWATRFGSTNYDGGLAASVAVAPDGSLRVAGTLRAPVQFGAGTQNEVNASGDVYLARFDKGGAFNWVRTAESDQWMMAYDVAVSANGTTALAGEFVSTGTFGAGEASETSWSPVNGAFFGGSFTQDGTLNWVVGTSGAPRTASTSAYGVAVSSTGDIAVTGMLSGVDMFAEFGEGAPLAARMTGANGALFVARYDADGQFVWARQLQPVSRGVVCSDVCVDDYGQSMGSDVEFTPGDGVVALGHYGGPFTLDSGGPSETTLEGSGGVLVEWDYAGSLRWVRHFDAQPDRLAVGSDGTLWVSGFLLPGTHVFGEGETTQQTIVVEQDSEAFVARFASDGSFQCVWHPSGTGVRRATGIAATPDGGAIVTGFFQGDVDFGGGSPQSSDSRDWQAFVVRFKP